MNVFKRMSDEMRELQKKFNVVCDEVMKMEKYIHALATVVLPPKLLPFLGPEEQTNQLSTATSPIPPKPSSSTSVKGVTPTNGVLKEKGAPIPSPEK